MATRRPLTFASLDDAVADAENLLAKGYEKCGNWTLGQCCGHVAHWLECGMNGFPKPPAPIRLFLWIARNSFGPGKLKQMMAGGQMPSGKPTMPESIPPATTDDAAAVARFKETVAKVKRFAGTPVPSPFFGPMDRDTWLRLNCVHAAHHLSFLVPRA